MNMPKLQHASMSKYFLASTALMLSAAMWPGSALAQAQTQAQTSQFGGGGFGGGGGGGGGSGGQQATDPGVRSGPAGAGGPLPNLSAAELAFFNAAAVVFENVDAVANGLGPGFNLNSCSGCHAAPATGGSSPATN